MIGTIRRLALDRGFGFLRADGTTQDYFFHRSAVLDAGGFEGLSEGGRVEFDVEESSKGPRACNVRAV